MRPSASPITDVLYIAHSDILHSVLLTNPYSNLHSGSITPFSDLLIAAYSNLHSVLPIISQKGLSTPNGDLLIAAHSNLHSVLPIIS